MRFCLPGILNCSVLNGSIFELIYLLYVNKDLSQAETGSYCALTIFIYITNIKNSEILKLL